MSEKKYAKYEERLKHIKELQKQIANPENGRLLKEHRQLEKELEVALSDPKMILFITFKEINNGKFYHREFGNDIVLHKEEWSESGHPKMYYFRRSGRMFGSIITSSSNNFEELTKEEALDKLLLGQGFMKEKS